MLKFAKAAALAAAMLAGSVTGSGAAPMLEIVGGVSQVLRTGSGTSSFNPANYYTAADPEALFRQGDTVTAIQGNDVLGSGTAKSASNGLKVNQQVFATFTYMGKEAGYRNLLLAMDGGYDTVFATSGTGSVAPGAVSGKFLLGPQFLDFKLESYSNGSLVSQFLNNGTATAGSGLAYVLGSSKTYAIMGFDDSGAGPDADYDDIVFRIDITAVPLPAAAWLLIGGITGLGFISRRRKAA